MRKVFSSIGRLPLFIGDGNLSESLDKSNRWYQLAEKLPWAKMEEVYISRLDPRRKGATNLPARLVLGAMLIQYIEKLTDRGTITAIQENPYMQYFVGLTHFTTTPIFDASLFVTLRKRISIEDINEISLILLETEKNSTAKDEKRDSDGDNDTPSPCEEEKQSSTPESDEATHQGSMTVDATCCPVNIPYPTDLRIIYESIQKLCRIRLIYGKVSEKERQSITKLSAEAKRRYHAFTLRKKKPKGGLKSTLRHMLKLLEQCIKGFLNQFGTNSTTLLDRLSNTTKRYIQTILKVYEQQSGKLYRGTKIAHRIVNIHQPHIRPIVRGKAGNPTEFGPKVNVSIVRSYAFIDQLSYEAFNEGQKLEEQIQLYQSRFGFLPQKVLADRIYLNKNNCHYMESKDIIPVGKRLGRPPKQEKTEAELKEMHRRNEVEGTFGTVKMRYGAARIRTRLPETTEVAVAMSFLAKNVITFLRELIRIILSLLFPSLFSPKLQMVRQYHACISTLQK